MRTFLVALTMLLAWSAGCAGPAADAGADASDDEAAPLRLDGPVDVLGTLAREPAIVQDHDGALYVAGYARSDVRLVVDTPPLLWKSVDDGATWTRVDVGSAADGALGNSDVDLAVGPDGTLYFATLAYTRIGQAISVGASDDGGETWRWRTISARAGVDRPWVLAAPDGVAHVVWNNGVEVRHARSEDRGGTWAASTVVHDRGGTGMLAISSSGTLAVRIIPASGSGYTDWPGQDGVAVSDDGGTTWTFHTLPGERKYTSLLGSTAGNEGDEVDRWADPLAYDADGTLYAAWPEPHQMMLARSHDDGASWDVHTLYAFDNAWPWYPHLRPTPHAGVLAMTFFTWDDGEVRAHVARVENADTDTPIVHDASLAVRTNNATGGEYFSVVFLDATRLGFALPIQGNDVGFAYYTAS